MAKKKTLSVIGKAAARVGRTLGKATRTLAPGAKAAKPAAAKAVKPVAPKVPRTSDTPVPQKVKRGQVVDERAIVRASAAPRWSNRKPR